MASGAPEASAPGILYCDLTQSWSAKGGGVGTYIRHKRSHILDHGRDRHLLIIPGEHDSTVAFHERVFGSCNLPFF